jgi:hypothetical protein
MSAIVTPSYRRDASIVDHNPREVSTPFYVFLSHYSLWYDAAAPTRWWGSAIAPRRLVRFRVTRALVSRWRAVRWSAAHFQLALGRSLVVPLLIAQLTWRPS